MLDNIKGIEGRYKEYPRSNCFMASFELMWTRTYRTLKIHTDRKRLRRGFSIDADWFLTMVDGTEYLLPDLDVMDDLETQLEQHRTDFWTDKLNIPQ